MATLSTVAASSAERYLTTTFTFAHDEMVIVRSCTTAMSESTKSTSKLGIEFIDIPFASVRLFSFSPLKSATTCTSKPPLIKAISRTRF